MINNSAIDVATGLFFIYALYSLLTTTLTELIASFINQRGLVLKMGIERMLDNDKPKDSEVKLSSIFFEKPEIKYLKAKTLGFTRFPSYLKPNTFVSTLLDTLGFVNPNSTDLASVRNGLDPNNETHKVLINLIDRANNNVDQFKILAEEWFNETMDRVSGWYKRYNQVITFFVGALLAFSLNINSVEIAKILSNDKDTRIAMVEATSNYMASLQETSDSLVDKKSLEELNKEVKLLIQETQKVNSLMSLPYPWLKSNETKVSWLSYIFGCLITTIALSLGSPFWFDLLSKIIKLRSSGNQEKTSKTSPPQKSPAS